MPYVIKHPNGTFLVKKNAWSTEWSDRLNDARVFPTKRATTAAKNTINTAYRTPDTETKFETCEIDFVLRVPQ